MQVGQCGNQIGCRFWDMALREHAAHNSKGRYDEALSSFFRNVDSRFDPPANLPVGDGRGAIRALKARAVLVDMVRRRPIPACLAELARLTSHTMGSSPQGRFRG